MVIVHTVVVNSGIRSMSSESREVDPHVLREPASRWRGADPVKLRWQTARYWASSIEMPPLIVYEGVDRCW